LYQLPQRSLQQHPQEQVVAQNDDLSASRYRQVEQEEVFYDQPAVTLKRMRGLEQVAESEVAALEAMLASHSLGLESRL
jgi:hypothetical protein